MLKLLENYYFKQNKGIKSFTASIDLELLLKASINEARNEP